MRHTPDVEIVGCRAQTAVHSRSLVILVVPSGGVVDRVAVASTIS